MDYGVDYTEYDKHLAEALNKPEPSGLLRRTVGDTAVNAVNAAIALPESAVGLADLVSGGRAGKALNEIGYKPAEAKATMSELFSPERKAALQEYQDAEGIGGKLKAAISNPSLIASGVVESLPQMAGGLAIAKGLVKLAPKLATLGAGSIGEMTAATSMGEGAMMSGAAAENIRQQSKDGLLTPKQAALAAGLGIVGGGISAVGGRLSNALGIDNMESILAGAAAKETGKATVRDTLTRMGKGALTEGLLEEVPQTLQETMATNLATDKPITENLAGDAVLAGLSGAAMGGGVHGFNAMSGRIGHGDTTPTAKATPVQPAVLNEAQVTPAQSTQEAKAQGAGTLKASLAASKAATPTQELAPEISIHDIAKEQIAAPVPVPQQTRDALAEQADHPTDLQTRLDANKSLDAIKKNDDQIAKEQSALKQAAVDHANSTPEIANKISTAEAALADIKMKQAQVLANNEAQLKELNAAKTEPGQAKVKAATKAALTASSASIAEDVKVAETKVKVAETELEKHLQDAPMPFSPEYDAWRTGQEKQSKESALSEYSKVDFTEKQIQTAIKDKTRLEALAVKQGGVENLSPANGNKLNQVSLLLESIARKQDATTQDVRTDGSNVPVELPTPTETDARGVHADNGETNLVDDGVGVSQNVVSIVQPTVPTIINSEELANNDLQSVPEKSVQGQEVMPAVRNEAEVASNIPSQDVANVEDTGLIPTESEVTTNGKQEETSSNNDQGETSTNAVPTKEKGLLKPEAVVQDDSANVPPTAVASAHTPDSNDSRIATLNVMQLNQLAKATDVNTKGITKNSGSLKTAIIEAHSWDDMQSNFLGNKLDEMFPKTNTTLKQPIAQTSTSEAAKTAASQFDTTPWKRVNPPQVSSPMVIESNIEVNGQKGKGYAFPGFEEYKFILLPPRGSKAQSNKAGFRIVEAITGRVFSESHDFTSKPTTASEAIEKAQGVLSGLSKQKLDETIAASQVMTEEQYLNSHGATFMKGAEPALHRTPGGFGKGVREKLTNSVQSAMEANDNRRAELRIEYANKVKAGELRPPTSIESSMDIARGHEDNASTQAARRILEKQGIDWQTGKALSVATTSDVTPDGYGATGEVAPPKVHDMLRGETIEQAINRLVGYQIDNGRVRIGQDTGGWKATVGTLNGKPQVVRSINKQQLMNQAFDLLHPNETFKQGDKKPITFGSKVKDGRSVGLSELMDEFTPDPQQDLFGKTIETDDGLPFSADIATPHDTNNNILKTDTITAGGKHTSKEIDLIKQVADKTQAEIAPVDVQGKQSDALREMAGKFGLNIAFYGNDTTAPNGFVSKSVPNTVFVNVGSNNHTAFILGHELSHVIETNEPAQYKQLLSDILPHLDSTKYAEFDKRIQGIDLYKGLDKNGRYKELVGDLFGKVFTDQTTLNTLATEKPTLFKKIVNGFYKLMDKLKQIVTPNRNASGVVTDIHAVNRIITDATKVYAAEHGNKTLAMHEIINLNNKMAADSDILYSAHTDAVDYVKATLQVDKVLNAIRRNPTVSAAAAMLDGIKTLAAPTSRSNAAKDFGSSMLEAMGTNAIEKEQLMGKIHNQVNALKGERTLVAKTLDLIQEAGKTAGDMIFNNRAKELNYKAISRYMRGIEQITKPEQKIFDALGTMFDTKAERIKALGTGVLDKLRENYFTGMWTKNSRLAFTQALKEVIASGIGKKGDLNTWSDEAKAAVKARTIELMDQGIGTEDDEIFGMLSKRPLEGQKGFTKSKIFDDFQTAIDFGLVPVSDNPLDLAALRMDEMDKYILAHTVMRDNADANNGVARLLPSQSLPEGWTRILPSHGVVSEIVTDENGNKSKKEKFTFIARADIAAVLNGYLSKSLYNDKNVGGMFSAYMGAANTLNQFQLGLVSAFHAGFTSFESVISHGAIGVKAFSRGDLKTAAKYLGSAPAAWITNPLRGDKIIEAIRSGDAQTGEMGQIIEYLKMAGAQIGMDTRFQTNSFQKAQQQWANGEKVKALLSPKALIEVSARPIMEGLVPRQKLGVFAEMIMEWHSRNENATHEERAKAAQQIWNRVDARLGQVVYDRLFMKNVTKNIIQALIRAPGWTGGTILEVGGGLVDAAAFMKDLAVGKKPVMTDRTAYIISLAIVHMTSNAILTALMTGEPPDDWKDLMAFRTGNLDEKGRPERFMIPTYAKDVYQYMQAPAGTLGNKAHPLLSLANEFRKNKDFYGTEIRSKDEGAFRQMAQVVAHGAKAFVPFSVRGFQKEVERGSDTLNKALPFVGVMPAPSYLNKSAAERLLSEYSADRMPQGARTAKETEKATIRQEVYNHIRKGESSEAMATYREAQQAGLMSAKDLHATQTSAKHSPSYNSFNRISNIDQLNKVWELATDKEQQEWEQLYLRKRRLLRAAV